MMTSDPNKLIRLGNRVFNLAHVSRIEFRPWNSGDPPTPTLMASVTFIGDDPGWAFLGKEAEELNEFLGGRFA
jgi:hypothetical protein